MGDTSRLVNLLPDGGDDARNSLISHASDRLGRLARKMLKGFPGVRQSEQTDDVLNSAVIRLKQALSGVSVTSSRHFWNLATLQIRRELIDMSRRYRGSQKQMPDPVTDRTVDGPGGQLQSQPDNSIEPDSLEAWTRFHEQIERLPENEQEVFGLIWYSGFRQKETAAQLGVTLDVVKKRWLSARLKLAKALSDEPPQ
jgi:RNA polymerase sigma factor (sigma-70 family)